MSDFITESSKLLDAIRDYWESKLAPIYASSQVRNEERQQLVELKELLKSGHLDQARKILQKWHQYHNFQGEFADSLMMAARHSNLAKRCQALLGLLPSE